MRVTLGVAERRSLQRLARPDGRMVVVALDQRASLRRMLRAVGQADDRSALYSVKREVTAALAEPASAILADPEVGLPGLLDDGLIPRDTGLLVALEETDPPRVDGLRRSRRLGTFGPEALRALGGDAAKLLVYVRPDRQDSVDHAGQLVRGALDACRRAALLLVVEVVVDPLPDEEPGAHERRLPLLVPQAVALAASWGAKVLKVQYPGTAAACGAVTEAAGVPWAVLSGGASFEVFRRRLQEALDAGASGFIAGRSLWQEAVGLDRKERRAFLMGEARTRLAELASMLRGHGRAWTEAVARPDGAVVDVSLG